MHAFFLLWLAPGAFAVFTVDISSYVANDNAEAKMLTARSMDEAMVEDGMMVVTGHGIPLSLFEEMQDNMAAFFHQDIDTKRQLGDSKVYGPEGYTERGVEAVSRSTGDAEAKADAVESFTFSTAPPYNPADEPEREALQGLDKDLCEVSRRYWNEMSRVLDVLHNVTADVMNVSSDFFPKHFDGNDSGTVIRLARYPEFRMDSGFMRYGTHTDYLTFTLLRATEPGLQLKKRDGSFVDVFPPQDSIVVNAGDLTEMWTNGRWRSAPHRAIPYPKADDPQLSAERYIIAFFTGPSHSTFVEPIVQPGDAPKFKGVTSGEWLRMKLDPTTTAATKAPNDDL